MMTEVKGWHVLSVLLLFFGVTISVNAYFVTVALTSSTGEYQKKSYLQGLRYNDVIDARARQAAQGWSAELSAEPAGGGAFEIAIRLTDRDGRPVNRLAVSGELRRPVQAAMDRPLTFQPAGEGLYRARADAVSPGRWRIAIGAEDATQRSVFRAEKDLWLR
jgi:nitrogen fixation protein FixH